MRRVDGNVVKLMKNRPWDVIAGSPFKVRIWENYYGLGRSELKAYFLRVSDESHSPSFTQEELQSIHDGSGKALRLMRKHQRRQLWRSVLFPW